MTLDDIADSSRRKKENSIRYIPEVSFKDIGGIDDIVATVREVIELPLKHPELLRQLGIKPHRGVLLHGEPGCGKTLIAKAIANDVRAHFIPIRGPELISKYWGESESNLRGVFEEARAMQPSIVFFDEIDAIAQERSSAENIRLEAALVNQLLTLMDGIDDYGCTCVIASTNRPELLDNALLRPGRFDYSLEVKRPNRDGCYAIFNIHTRCIPMEGDFDLYGFSEELVGLTGAEIAFVAREGAYNCLRRSVNFGDLFEKKDVPDKILNSLEVSETDFENALMKVTKERT